MLKSKTYVVAITVLIGLSGILFEFMTPLGIAAGVIYVIFVLTARWYSSPYLAFIFGGVASVLVLLGSLYSPDMSAEIWVVQINRTLSILAIWVVAFMVYVQKKDELKLIKALAHLERLNDDLRTLSYVSSHDIKAPIIAIKNLCNWLEQDAADQLDPENMVLLRKIRSRVTRLQNLLADILTYSRAEGKMTGSKQSVYEVMTEILKDVNLDNKFDITLDKNLASLSVKTEPIQHIFQNLIGNAIKHHHKGSGHIQVSGLKKGDWYHFQITDDGPGVPDEYKAKIFEMFKTLHSRDVIEGSGMGLSLARKLVRVYGGDLILTDNEKGGSTFSFRWPAVPQ